MSCLTRKFHEQFLGEGIPAMVFPYPTCDVRLHRIIAPESVKALKEPAVPPAVLLGGEAGR